MFNSPSEYLAWRVGNHVERSKWHQSHIQCHTSRPCWQSVGSQAASTTYHINQHCSLAWPALQPTELDSASLLTINSHGDNDHDEPQSLLSDKHCDSHGQIRRAWIHITDSEGGAPWSYPDLQLLVGWPMRKWEKVVVTSQGVTRLLITSARWRAPTCLTPKRTNDISHTHCTLCTRSRAGCLLMVWLDQTLCVLCYSQDRPAATGYFKELVGGWVWEAWTYR